MSKADTLKPERIAKVIARAGICSRREAERLIEAGEVKVNDQLLNTPAFTVTPKDKIEVKGRVIEEQKPDTRLFLFHKPSGCITSNKDPEGRQTVFDLLPKDLPRLITVGRLDFNTEGLLLLTNDGELARHLEHPKNDFVRTYRVRAYGHPDEKKLEALKKGITIEGIHYGPIHVEIESQTGDNVWLRVSITEGKNREVRKVMEEVGLTVNRLIRISFGPFELQNTPRGTVKEIYDKVLRKLLPSAL